MIPAPFILLAALARVLVGMGLASRWLVYAPVALICAWYSLGMSVEAAIVALCAMLNIGLGWTKWEMRQHQAIRYSAIPTLLSLVASIAHEPHLALSCLAWAFACAIVGAFEIDVRRKLERYGFTIFGRKVSSAQYAEFVIGAVCLGGASLLVR
jgi:hypothetical protein